MPNQPKKNTEEKSRLQKSKVVRIVSSALIAFCLWFYVISVQRTETVQSFSNVEVEFEGASVLEDRGLKLISDTDMEVDLKLSGRRSVLNSLRSSDLTVRVDLTRIYEAGSRGMTYEIIYPGDVSGSDIEVVSRTPDTIKVTVVSWAEKRVTVKEPVITGTPGEGFRLGTIESEDWNPKSMKIAGAKEIIDRIQYAGVVVDVQGATESMEVRQSFVYYDVDGNVVEVDDSVTANPETAQVRVPVLMERDVALKLPLDIDKNAVDTEFSLTLTVTLPDGTKTEVTGVILNTADGLISKDTIFGGLEEGQPYLDLGNVVAYGSLRDMEYVTEAKLPEMKLSGVLRKEYSAQDIDLQQDGISCEIQSVVVSVETRVMETREFEVVIQNESGFQFTVTRPVGGFKVKLKGFAEDLDKIRSQDMLVLIPNGTKAGDRFDLEVTFREAHPEIIIVEVPNVKANANVSHLSYGGAQQT